MKSGGQGLGVSQQMQPGFGETFGTDNTTGNKAYTLIVEQAKQGEAPISMCTPRTSFLPCSAGAPAAAG